MALKITDTMLRMAEDAMRQGNAAGAWSVLSSAGDLYAANAYDIIEEIDAPNSVFLQKLSRLIGTVSRLGPDIRCLWMSGCSMFNSILKLFVRKKQV